MFVVTIIIAIIIIMIIVIIMIIIISSSSSSSIVITIITSTINIFVSLLNALRLLACIPSVAIAQVPAGLQPFSYLRFRT